MVFYPFSWIIIDETIKGIFNALINLLVHRTYEWADTIKLTIDVSTFSYAKVSWVILYRISYSWRSRCYWVSHIQWCKGLPSLLVCYLHLKYSATVMPLRFWTCEGRCKKQLRLQGKLIMDRWEKQGIPIYPTVFTQDES